MANDKSEGSMKIDVALVRELAQLLADTDLSEIEVEDDDRRIRVARQITSGVVSQVVAAPVAAAPAAAAAPATEAAAPAGEDLSAATKSPMVGTAYLAPEPGAPNFVAIGDKVTAGQTLLIIEAMKTFNPIKAPKAGTVTQVLVENAQPVEFGEPLMVVE